MCWFSRPKIGWLCGASLVGSETSAYMPVKLSRCEREGKTHRGASVLVISPTARRSKLCVSMAMYAVVEKRRDRREGRGVWGVSGPRFFSLGYPAIEHRGPRDRERTRPACLKEEQAAYMYCSGTCHSAIVYRPFPPCSLWALAPFSRDPLSRSRPPSPSRSAHLSVRSWFPPPNLCGSYLRGQRQ